MCREEILHIIARLYIAIVSAIIIVIAATFYANATNKFIVDIVEFIESFFRRLERNWRSTWLNTVVVIVTMRIDSRQHK